MTKQQTLIQMNDYEAQLVRKRIKNINLRIDRAGHVKVSAPLRCSLITIQQFLQEKHGWIVHHRTRLLQQGQKIQTALMNGTQHFFLGQSYTLMVFENSNNSDVHINENQICCYVREQATQEVIQILLQNWHRLQMKTRLPDLFKKWETMIGVQANQWGIRLMKTRWGSCQPRKKRISLNLHLMCYPIECLEYVIVHELVHILEASHNKRFYALMSQFMPEWQQHKRLLKDGIKG